MDHVTFRYRPRPGQAAEDDEPALRDVTFTIEPATAVAVVGATGSGKSTLAKLLTRLADPTEGAVRIAGIDLRDVRMASLRATLVMVPQEPFLFDTTIMPRTSASGARAPTDDEVQLAFTELGLDDWLDGLGAGPTRRSASGASTSRPVSASSWPWPGPTSPTRRASCSTRPPRRSTPPPRPAWPGPSTAWPGAAPRSPSPTGCRRRPGRDWILVFDRGRLVEQGPHDDLLANGGVYAGLHASWLDATTANDGLPVPLG